MLFLFSKYLKKMEALKHASKFLTTALLADPMF